MRRLANVGPVVRGSLCTVQRGGQLAHQLTVSVKGKTHTVYVPAEMVQEVKTWIRNHRWLRDIIKDISKVNMAIIHRHVPESRAGDKFTGKRHRSP